MNHSKSALLLLIISFLLSTNLYGQYNTELLNHKTIITVENGKLVDERLLHIQINDKESSWIADIEIPYNESEKFEILDASILDSNGNTIRSLRKKDFITRSDISYGSFYEDNFIKEFHMKWNVYPYQIRYRYRKTVNEFLFITKWYPYINTRIPVRKASIEIHLPKDLKNRIYNSKMFEYSSLEYVDQIIHNWEIENLNPIREEGFSPPIQTQIPCVTVVPIIFNYEIIGNQQAWSSYGYWLSQLNSNLDVLPQAEMTKVDELIKGINDPYEKVKTLYHYMQDNTRYINVAIDHGGLKPYPASYVSKKKYGDCKALSIYMKALLKQAGIESYYTDIYAGNNFISIDKSNPSQQFNHVILCVPIEEDTIWLENTAGYLPFDYTGTFTQGRYGLVVNNDESKLVRTPQLDLKDVLERNTYQFTLNTEGAGHLNITKEVRGGNFENFKAGEYFLSEPDYKELIKENCSIPNCKVLATKLYHTHRDSTKVIINCESTAKNQFKDLGSNIAITPFQIKLSNFEPPDKRESSVRINYPVNQKDSIVYNLPMIDSYNIKLPENVSIQSDYGSLQIIFTQKKDQIAILRNYILLRNEVSLEDYSEFYSFFKLMKQAQKKSVIIFNKK